MVGFARLSGAVARASKSLKAREEAQDRLLVVSRECVRACSLCVKAAHAGELDVAGAELARAKRLVSEARRRGRELPNVAMQAYQEFCEASVLLAVLGNGDIPSDRDLGVPFAAYATGLMDAVGEFRREMLEALKRGDTASAERMFAVMSAIYDETLALRFSNSILPNFRKKQDVARIQLEMARSELLRCS
jgi:translin